MADKKKTTEENIKEQLDMFIPEEEMELPSGRKIDFPKTSWKTEKQILDEFNQLLAESPELGEVDLNNFTMADAQALVNVLAVKMPSRVTRMMSLITGLSAEKIDDEWDILDIAYVLVPFCMHKFGTLTKLFSQPDLET